MGTKEPGIWGITTQGHCKKVESILSSCLLIQITTTKQKTKTGKRQKLMVYMQENGKQVEFERDIE